MQCFTFSLIFSSVNEVRFYSVKYIINVVFCASVDGRSATAVELLLEVCHSCCCLLACFCRPPIEISLPASMASDTPDHVWHVEYTIHCVWMLQYTVGLYWTHSFLTCTYRVAQIK